MATTAKITKQQIPGRIKYKNRYRNRCLLCGRPRATIRIFGLCRLCFRELADRGDLPGVKKASW